MLKITEQNLEQEFIAWSKDFLHTVDVDHVWVAAANFLSHHAPEYRTTGITGQLVRAYLKTRPERFEPCGRADIEITSLEEVLISLNKRVKYSD